MASITCRNGGTTHTHLSVVESKVCFGVLGGAPSGTVVAPVSPPVEGATHRQVQYVGTLGGDQDYAAGLTKKTCSDYINSLLAKGKKPVTAPTPAPAPAPVPSYRTTVYRQERTKRQDFILGLLPGIPDGYFAVSPDGSDAKVSFIRVKRPKSGEYKNCVKVQTQHSEQLDNKFIYNMTRDSIWEKRGCGNEIEELHHVPLRRLAGQRDALCSTDREVHALQPRAHRRPLALVRHRARLRAGLHLGHPEH